MSAPLGIIAGTGFAELPGFKRRELRPVDTRWGEPSAPLQVGRLGDREVLFLARHGIPHHIPPHRVNYRANIQALVDAGVGDVLAIAAVGGIASFAPPAAVVIPDQVIDYSWGRASTFFEDDLDTVTHIDFTLPFDDRVRDNIVWAARAAGIEFHDGGVYGCTQGPRLETAAEIRRLSRDGCDLVGMTAMPEAALAREAGLAYASVNVVANWAAGLGSHEITMDEIHAALKAGMGQVERLLDAFTD